MKSYPYIGRNKHDVEFLVFSETRAIVLNGVNKGDEHNPSYFIRRYKNITHEYLANTYGKVVSPEHAEFIIELAELHGFELIANSTSNKKFFHIGVKSFAMLTNEPRFKGDCKQIKIPLPPKQIQTATPEEEFEMKQIMKNAGDNLVLGCEDSKCDEWPCVGDEILTASKSKAKVLAKHGGKLWIEYINGGKGFNTINAATIQKPKTPEEELRDEIVQLIDDADGLSSHVLALSLMDKFNIKPQ